jgi:hypothetical protein
MAAHGEIDMPACAIFADTQWEPRAVYDHLNWLRSGNVLPFPVHVVTAGSIRESIRTRRTLKGGGRFAPIPWYIANDDGSAGMGRRQCSTEYKLEPIAYKIRDLLGKGRRARIRPGSVEVMIGISRDEAHRMRPSRQAYMINRYPLVERGMRRYDCLLWLKRHGYPEPPKSACIGCPFTDNARWRERREIPDEWADAVQADRELREGDARGMRGLEFMHRSRLPLEQVDLSVDDSQLDLFGNECEGLCGV